MTNISRRTLAYSPSAGLQPPAWCARKPHPPAI